MNFFSCNSKFHSNRWKKKWNLPTTYVFFHTAFSCTQHLFVLLTKLILWLKEFFDWFHCGQFYSADYILLLLFLTWARVGRCHCFCLCVLDDARNKWLPNNLSRGNNSGNIIDWTSNMHFQYMIRFIARWSRINDLYLISIQNLRFFRLKRNCPWRIRS